MASKTRTIYTGVTSALQQRVIQHKEKKYPGFSAKYNTNKLVYYEEFIDIRDAIAREKQIKGLLRIKKIALIESLNPEWRDLSLDLW